MEKTAWKVSFQIRNLVGNSKVIIRKAGYKKKEMSLIIEDGIKNELNAELEKA